MRNDGWWMIMTDDVSVVIFKKTMLVNYVYVLSIYHINHKYILNRISNLHTDISQRTHLYFLQTSLKSTFTVNAAACRLICRPFRKSRKKANWSQPQRGVPAQRLSEESFCFLMFFPPLDFSPTKTIQQLLQTPQQKEEAVWEKVVFPQFPPKIK